MLSVQCIFFHLIMGHMPGYVTLYNPNINRWNQTLTLSLEWNLDCQSTVTTVSSEGLWRQPACPGCTDKDAK